LWHNLRVDVLPDRVPAEAFRQRQAERLGTVREVVDTTATNDHVECTASHAEGEMTLAPSSPLWDVDAGGAHRLRG
jgi:hypothetical protein